MDNAQSSTEGSNPYGVDAMGAVDPRTTEFIRETQALSLVVRPHANHLDDALLLQHLVYEPVLNIDTTRICSGQVANEFLKRWNLLKGIGCEDVEEQLNLGSKSGRGHAF